MAICQDFGVDFFDDFVLEIVGKETEDFITFCFGGILFVKIEFEVFSDSILDIFV